MYRLSKTSEKFTLSSNQPQLPISAVILTYNEEINLVGCLQSLVGWVGEIFVVDSGSEDRTQEIAREYGATVLCHPYEGPRQQWEWALANIPFAHDWFLMLDADLRISPTLQESIVQALSQPDSCSGYYLGRLQLFRGQPLRHGGMYPRYQLRLVRLSKASFSQGDTFMDEQWSVAGKTARLKGDLIEENVKEDDIMFYLQKHLRYATLQAQQELIWRTRRTAMPAFSLPVLQNPTQRKEWLKDLWNRLPFFLRPFIYFIYRYIFRLGFLDGKQGFVYHFLQAWWYRVIVDIKLEELIKKEQLTTEY
ncbi:MAG: glycosyltransferase family 2 protein [Anaerolineales bacterium]|nr:glycosyltransferase family 2 protein [Anaerolineales bacterium]